STRRDAKKRRQKAERLDRCPRSLRANLKAGPTKQRGEGQLRIRQKEDRRVKKQKGTAAATTTIPFPNATAKEQTEQARSAAKTAKPTEPGPEATTERPAAERSEGSTTTTTTTAAATAKPESAGSKGSAAGTKPAVAGQIGQRQGPKRTTAKRPVSGEKRTAKETAATTGRESISLARRRKEAGQSAIAFAGTTTG